jgi:hypothetical protein
MDLEELKKISRSGKFPDAARRIARALSSGMNDWPTPNLIKLEQFVSELRTAYGPLSFSNLNEAAKDKRTLLSEPWKSEALAEVLEAWDAKTIHLTLEELIDELRKLTASQGKAVS